MLQKLKLALSCALLAALTGVAVQAVLLLHAATRATVALPQAVSAELQTTRSALLTEVQSTRKDLTGQIEGARKDVLVRAERQVVALRGDTVSVVKDSLSTADRRIGDSLARVDTALATVDRLRKDLQPTLQNIAAATGHANSIAAHVDGAMPAFTDCAILDENGVPVGGNPDCAFNRFQGASKALERAAVDVSGMARDFHGALPKALATWQDIGVQVEGTASNVKKLTTPHWYDRALGYGYTGIQIYRDLNPASSIVSAIQVWKATRQ